MKEGDGVDLGQGWRVRDIALRPVPPTMIKRQQTAGVFKPNKARVQRDFVRHQHTRSGAAVDTQGNAVDFGISGDCLFGIVPQGQLVGQERRIFARLYGLAFLYLQPAGDDHGLADGLVGRNSGDGLNARAIDHLGLSDERGREGFAHRGHLGHPERIDQIQLLIRGEREDIARGDHRLIGVRVPVSVDVMNQPCILHQVHIASAAHGPAHLQRDVTRIVDGIMVKVDGATGQDQVGVALDVDFRKGPDNRFGKVRNQAFPHPQPDVKVGRPRVVAEQLVNRRRTGQARDRHK